MSQIRLKGTPEERNRRRARVDRAQRLLDGDVGMRVLADHMRQRMNDSLRTRMSRRAEELLQLEGVDGIRVTVGLDINTRMATLRAHAADRR